MLAETELTFRAHHMVPSVFTYCGRPIWRTTVSAISVVHLWLTAPEVPWAHV